MKAKPVIPRALANQDVEDAIGYYLGEQAEQAALGFIDALEKAYSHISRHPASGMPRYAHELDLPGLLYWPLKRHPYLVFYGERDDHVDVWRVLHGVRDIPEGLVESASH
ncbi:type II toxin-antitoxin system RelE/ParE family toxin [Pseudomonas sp. p1(2021b)]|uniref:type II toxin-antitoxin system RelE/ParE family toxin n=1 Tax=Pseudomonas sp. p1(2021b) TaxID=2874628 RepID=UPI001CCBBDD3|nr:type II toxin-antitoxin system RelE/ParE family toxin [Pseudomonas sp. p1(2021b)]UBM27086.1 type II toxin-antitoxin system RelE/ParE family toxin [Pseudomonas sp. p1(2021b)]